MSKRLTIAEFIFKSREVHGDTYDYSKVVYVDAHTKVIIICPVHGEFKQKPNSHLNGQGCKDCYNETKGDRNRLTTAEFIRRARAVHGDKYDYSKAVYKHSSEDVIIICPVHGEFPQKPTHHLRGRGCSKCSGKYQPTTAEFIARAKAVHGDTYDYSKTEYSSMHSDVIIICPIHGEFPQAPHTHLKDSGCGKCDGKGFEHVSYNEAKRIIKPFGLRTNIEYKIWWKANEKFCREVGLPYNPDVVYSRNK